MASDQSRTPVRRLWVDDERPAPDGWVWAKTSAEAIVRLAGLDSDDPRAFGEVSLDHDLGGDDTTRQVVLWLCEHGGWPSIVRVHTANPVGRDWLVGMVERYGPGVAA